MVVNIENFYLYHERNNKETHISSSSLRCADITACFSRIVSTEPRFFLTDFEPGESVKSYIKDCNHDGWYRTKEDFGCFSFHRIEVATGKENALCKEVRSS